MAARSRTVKHIPAMSKDDRVLSQRACQRCGPRHVPRPECSPNFSLSVNQLSPFAPLTPIRLAMLPRSFCRRRRSCNFLRVETWFTRFPTQAAPRIKQGLQKCLGILACRNESFKMSRLLQRTRASGEKPAGFLGRGQLLGASLLPLSNYFKAFTPLSAYFPQGSWCFEDPPHP